MKYKIYVVLLLFTALLGACQRKTILEPATLEILPSGLISLDSQEHTEVVGITTNQDDWTFVKNVDWLSVTQNQGDLTITVPANSSTEARQAEILVIAGEAREKIRIEQQGTQVAITTSQQKIETNQWGGSFTLDVESNNSDWVAETSEDWIHLTPVYTMSELRISVDETKESDDRIGKIYLKTKDGRGLYEVAVSQSGVMYYLLPFDGFLESAENLRQYEYGRKSELSLVPDGTFNLYNWGFKTKSTAFGSITYLVYNNRYKTAKVYCSTPNFFENQINLEGQKTFLMRQGFEQKSDLVFYHPDKHILAQIVKDGGSPHVYYTFRPEQPTAQTTMSDFPYRYMKFETGAFSAIQAWETTNGGTFNSSRSSVSDPNYDRDILWFDAAQPPLLATVYRVSRATSDHTITSLFLILRDTSNVYYTAGGTLLLTNEFIDLMKREGFVSLGDVGPGYHFYHFERMIEVLVSLAQIDGFDEPKVQIQISPLSEE